MKGAAGGHSDQEGYWHGWGWISLCLDQVRMAEIGDAGFPEVAVAGHILGAVYSSLRHGIRGCGWCGMG